MISLKDFIFAFVFLLIQNLEADAQRPTDVVILCEPSVKFASRDTALISWTSQNRSIKEYKVFINSNFEDELESYLTTDTALIIPPVFAPGEEVIHVHISHASVEHDEPAYIVLNRVDYKKLPDEIKDQRIFTELLTELLKQKMFPTAYYLYHRYRSVFPSNVYTSVFNEVFRNPSSMTDVTVIFKNGAPVVERKLNMGAVHR